MSQPMRADALKNRERILDAAEAVFFEQGAAAPLQQIARRAGVGQGTLYRHFPEREAVILALFERRVRMLQELPGESEIGPRTLEHYLTAMLEVQERTPGLVSAILASQRYGEQLARLREQVGDILEKPIAVAKAHGLLHPDITPDDMLTVWAMYEGVTATFTEADYAERAARARQLIVRALRSVGDRMS